MSYPHLIQFDGIALREELRKRLAFEVEATRGRTMWREPRAARHPRFRFRLRAARV